MAGAYAKIEGHEELCAERYRALGVEIRDLKEGLRGMQKAAWGVVAGIAAYLLVQVYGDLKARPQAAAVVVGTPAAAPASAPGDAGGERK